MPRRKRPRIPPTEEWEQLRLLLDSPEQTRYEVLRPIVLFGASPAERARQTSVPERTLRRKADQFDVLGMASLFAPDVQPPAPGDRRLLPPHLRQLIVDLKAEFPAFRPRELARICYVASGRRPSPQTIQRTLATGPVPTRTERRYPSYDAMTDPAEARLAIVRLHTEGWTVTSIAAYLETSRQQVYRTLRRWVEEGVAGLDDKPRTRKKVALKVDLAAHAAVKKLQANPLLGEFRIHAALKQMGIHLSPRTCGRILALHRHLYALPAAESPPKVPKAMPFAAQRRHQYWTVDIRYIEGGRHQLGSGDIYIISILENYSRAILASAPSWTQDLTAYLRVLFAAIAQFGSPEALVSDGGGVFRAKHAQRIYRVLDIQKEQIAKRQPWQSYIEANFGVQRRLADWHFEHASTWEAFCAAHDRWMTDFNHQVHWAHRERQDGRHSPAEVLGWVQAQVRTPEHLHRIFYTTRFRRTVTKSGYVRFRDWFFYGEEGLARHKAVVWVYEHNLTVEAAEQPLAQYKVEYQPDHRHFRDVIVARVLETGYRSPQMRLWEWRDDEWKKAYRAPAARRRRRRQLPTACQESLLPLQP